MFFFFSGFFFSVAGYFVIRSCVRDPTNHSLAVGYMTALLAGVLIGASGFYLLGF